MRRQVHAPFETLHSEFKVVQGLGCMIYGAWFDGFWSYGTYGSMVHMVYGLRCVACSYVVYGLGSMVYGPVVLRLGVPG